MLEKILGLESDQKIDSLTIGWSHGPVIALTLIILAVIFSVYLYRSERQLPKSRRIIMTVCQGLALLVLIIIFMGPFAKITKSNSYKRNMLVLIDTSSSMATKDQRNANSIEEAARALGVIKSTDPFDPGEANEIQKEIGNPSRIKLATATLEKTNVISDLKDKFNVNIFTFDSQLKPIKQDEKVGEAEETETQSISLDLNAQGESTEIGSAINEAVGKFAGREVAGVMVLSDFISIKGKDPVESARSLSTQGIPIYTVSLGLPSPPDIHVRKIIGPDVVFKGDRVPLRVQIESKGYNERTVNITLKIDGNEQPSQQVKLKDGIQFAELIFVPEQESGTVELEVSAAAFNDETTDKNNSASHSVRILDEKIKVLYVEGIPRWEFRYLRWVLLRDPRLDVRFLMTQGDPALAGSSPSHIGALPQNKEELFKYDLIILGDVPAGYFNTEQLELIDELVKERGGSLMMLAGPVAAPTSYKDTAIADILPIKIGAGSWNPVPNGTYPVVTSAGRLSQSTSLSLSDDTTDRIWQKVNRMHQLPPVDGAKAGATVLLTHSGSSDGFDQYPLVAWQRYGTGKSLFVGTEDLWRMRLEVGDRYHARFWGQTIQFLTLSRLLGQNKQITIETDRASFSEGDTVQIYANVLTESFEPVTDIEEYTVLIEPKGSPDSSSEIQLSPVPGTDGLFSGAHVAGKDGAYVLKAEPSDESRANSPEFEVATINPEDRETGARPDIAKEIAEISGGKELNQIAISGFKDNFNSEKPRDNEVQIIEELWDKEILFILVLLFAGTEWFFRRRENLV
jgi:uncharacterized membrane protein